MIKYFNGIILYLILLNGIFGNEIEKIYPKVINFTLMNSNKPVYSDLVIDISTKSTKMILYLKLNVKLFSDNYIEKTYAKSKEVFHHSKDDNCYYMGYVNDDIYSSSALDICDGLRGYIYYNNKVLRIEPLMSKSNFSQLHNIYYENYLRLEANHTCGQEKSHNFLNKTVLKWFKNHRIKRWLDGSDSNSLIVELYLVNDYFQFATFKYNVQTVFERSKQIVNVINSLYRHLNIYFILVGIEVWTERNKIDIVDNADKTMNNFLEYRRLHISPKHPNDNAQLIMGHRLGEGVVGKAPIMTMCSWQHSGGISLDQGGTVGPIATTIAHEIGHNFGLAHDKDDCVCVDQRCIMSPSSGGHLNPTHWSTCSKNQLTDALYQGIDYCLHNLPIRDEKSQDEKAFDERKKLENKDGSEKTIVAYSDIRPFCGNSLLEFDEECDCGLPEHCVNYCCDPFTCKMRRNATCSTGDCCDLNTCKVKKVATECRKSIGKCDLAEYCDGSSNLCPFDVFVSNGQHCLTEAEDYSYCHEGRCRSRNSQCRLLWGQTGTESHKLCYDKNIQGTSVGNCGFDWLSGHFYKCLSSYDVMCGMLHCEHTNERVMLWKESLAPAIHESTIHDEYGRLKDCKSVVLDVGIHGPPDPGLVPDGSVCGEGKICINKTCRLLTFTTCPDCNGHGICNSLGQCHCDSGYSPPYCDKNGLGGSLHSNPITTKTESNGYLFLILAILLVIIIFFIIIICLIWHRKVICKNISNRDKYRSLFLPKISTNENLIDQNSLPYTAPPPAKVIAPSAPTLRSLEPTRCAPSPPSTLPSPKKRNQNFNRPKSLIAESNSPESKKALAISNPLLLSTTNLTVAEDDEIEFSTEGLEKQISTLPKRKPVKIFDNSGTVTLTKLCPTVPEEDIYEEIGDVSKLKAPSFPPPPPPDVQHQFFITNRKKDRLPMVAPRNSIAAKND